MNKLLYISVHSILEFDEVKLFTELGYDVYSWGAYLEPKGNHSLPRPGILGMKLHPEFVEFARTNSRNNIPKAFFDQFDVIVIAHAPDVLLNNWERMKHKPVIWRSIGQSNPTIELQLKGLTGLHIVRYSPMEQQLPHYCGQETMIRFYKDPDEYSDWLGANPQVINITQSLKARTGFCHYQEITEMMEGTNGKIYGINNEDLGTLDGGNLSYPALLRVMREARVFVYGGTWPAPYTLAFVEAWIMGIPIVAIGKEMAEQNVTVADVDKFPFYEVGSLIQNGITGFESNSMFKLRNDIFELLRDYDLAKRISIASRTEAIKIFGKATIKEQWKQFLAQF